MTDENDSPDDEENRTTGGLLGAIRQVVDTLADAEREGRTRFGKTGRVPGNHFTTEYGFSGRLGNSRTGGESATRSDDQYLVDVRETDDELLVVADMPDADPDDITAGIDEDHNELVVGVGTEAVERMALPWPVERADAQFQHGVLELRFTREEDEE